MTETINYGLNATSPWGYHQTQFRGDNAPKGLYTADFNGTECSTTVQ
jgi:hypothetical protein